MKPVRTCMFLNMLSWIVLALVAGGGLIRGQEPSASTQQPLATAGGWRRVSDPPPAQPAEPKDPEPMARADAPGETQDPPPARLAEIHHRRCIPASFRSA